MHVVWYLQGSKDYRLFYNQGGDAGLVSYSDLD